MQFLEAVVIGFAEFADGLVADLANALALQVHILGDLRHRLVLLTNAEEGIDDLGLTLVKGAQGILNSLPDGLGVDTLIGHGGVPIDEHGEQTHIGTMP